MKSSSPSNTLKGVPRRCKSPAYTPIKSEGNLFANRTNPSYGRGVKSYIFLLLLLISATICRAQIGEDSVAYRLVTIVVTYGVKGIDKDSTSYSYTGEHGGTLPKHLNYSTCDDYYFNKKLNKFTLSDEIIQTFNSDDRVDTMLTLRYYDGGKKCINKSQQTSLYNSNNYKTLDLYVDWDSTARGWGWDTSSKHDYTYDGFGNLITDQSFIWDIWEKEPPYIEFPDGNGWSPFKRTDYTYNSTNIFVSSVTTRESFADEFMDDFVYIKVFCLFDKTMNDSVELTVGYNDTASKTDTLCRVITILGQRTKKDSVILEQDWDTTQRQWVNQQRDCYTYGDDNSVFISDQYREDNHWHMNKDTYIKSNSMNLPVEKILREYFIKKVWQEKTFYTYQTYHLKKKKSK